MDSRPQSIRPTASAGLQEKRKKKYSNLSRLDSCAKKRPVTILYTCSSTDCGIFPNSLSIRRRTPSINVRRCSFEANWSCLNLGSNKVATQNKFDRRSSPSPFSRKQKSKSSRAPDLGFGSGARILRLGQALFSIPTAVLTACWSLDLRG